VRYLLAAEQVGEWLLSTAVRSPDGWYWPARPGASSDVGPGLGWGTAAPTMFFVEAFRTTGDERWLTAARGGSRWMAGSLDAVTAEAGCGLFTGIGGWAVTLHELANAADDEASRDLAGRVIRAIVANATDAEHGTHWHNLTEILWGTAGIGCLLLTLGPEYLGPTAVPRCQHGRHRVGPEHGAHRRRHLCRVPP
jgi:hypothetical protein